MLFKKTTQNSGDQASWLLKLSAGSRDPLFAYSIVVDLSLRVHNRRIGIHLSPSGIDP